MLAKVDEELKDENENRTEQFLLLLTKHLDKVPEHLRGHCKVNLSEHYEAGEIPVVLSPIWGPLKSEDPYFYSACEQMSVLVSILMPAQRVVRLQSAACRLG